MCVTHTDTHIFVTFSIYIWIRRMHNISHVWSKVVMCGDIWIRRMHNIYVRIHTFDNVEYIIHPHMDQNPCSRTTLQTLQTLQTLHPLPHICPESKIVRVRVQRSQGDLASLFPAGPGGVWSGRCTGRPRWCQVKVCM